jgi:hypothetical protein
MGYGFGHEPGLGALRGALALTGYIRVSILMLAAVSGLSLSACASRKKAAEQGLQGAALPDEFRVISRRPLMVPPEYALRPPVPGKPRPQELQPESAARTALLGQAVDPQASQGEHLLLTKAGVDQSNANIRQVVDDEFGDVAYKSKSFADKVMFWRHGQPDNVNTGGSPTPLDPAAEQKRIQTLTGGKDVTIVREAPTPEKRKIKLPGL